MQRNLSVWVSGILFLISLLFPLSAWSQERTVTWKVIQGKTADGVTEIIFDGKIERGWHTYGINHKITPTTVEFVQSEGYTLEGGLYELLPSTDYNGDQVFFDNIKIGQKIRMTPSADSLKGVITSSSCKEEVCNFPDDWEFAISLKPESPKETITAADSEKSADNISVAEKSEEDGESIWTLIVEAILWGFAMLLTPCVFPMVPMTVSFFMKGSSSPAAGRFKAFMYGLFIVLLYTVPICVIIGITWIVGGDTVTADIFNWLSTHWLPNLVFFLVFMIFAASFFGAFEITLPSSLVNKSDKNSDRGGLAGIFFMALTLVLVSFSCTGPIVGTVLIKSTQGEFWTPMVTMLAFSVAFALPFTIFAMFPNLLKKLKSGSWLNSVKVVLGFIEVALGFKFLSMADMTYHWGLLDREVYLAIWIVVFSLLGFYLLGKIKFANDSDTDRIGILRLILVITDFSFVVYMIPGMFGAPLKALSGYLPPIETQDFVVWNTASNVIPSAQPFEAKEENGSNLHMPLGLSGYFTLEEGLAASKESGKPVFVDITGLACVNCREMEQRVWSDPKVLSMLRNDFIIVSLVTDDKTKLPEKDWITAKNGKILKDRGRINSYIVRERFGVNAQPNYTVLASDGTQLVPIRGYNLDIDGYVQFLQSGLDAFANYKK